MSSVRFKETSAGASAKPPLSDALTTQPLDNTELRRRVVRAGRSKDVVSLMQSPTPGFDQSLDLIHLAAREGVLTEPAFHLFLTQFFRERRFKEILDYCADDTLGFETLRNYHRVRLGLQQSSPDMPLARMIEIYRQSELVSLTRLPFQHVMLNAAQRERDWTFVRTWLANATDRELAHVPVPTTYGIIIASIKDGERDLAQEIATRITPHLTALQQLKLFLPFWHLEKPGATPPSNRDLMMRLDQANGDCGEGWVWLRDAYLEKLATIGTDLTELRIKPEQLERLRDLIMTKLSNHEPLSYQRMGDGSAYLMPLPDAVAVEAHHWEEDTDLKETIWWGRQIDRAKGQLIADRVREACSKADVLGICSPHRFIRDAIPDRKFEDWHTGRMLLAHVNALGTSIPLHDKVITEERSHAVVFRPDFVHALCAAATNVVFVGSLSPRAMNLPDADAVTHIATTPQVDLNMPVAENGRWIVDDYDSLAADLAAACRPGTLALIAAGYGGKPLVHLARLNGAVALDIGSTADEMAGLITRSPSDLL